MPVVILVLSPLGHRRFPEPRNLVNAITNLCGMDEMTAQMRDVFQEDHLVSKRNIIEQHEVLMDLPHVADMRHYR